MKKILLLLIVPAAFVVAMLVGSKVRTRSLVNTAVEKIKMAHATSPTSAAVNAVAKPTAKTTSLPDPAGANPGHGNVDVQIARTRELMRLKRYERLVLKADQRTSFKKVFIAIAMNPQSDWLTQRQALRNLYLHRLELSKDESDKLMASVDQRAMNSLKQTDAELLRNTVSAL